MRLAAAAKLFAYRTLWRRLGLEVAGEGLLCALGSDDEDLRTLAGMFLVQGGERSAPLLEQALDRRDDLPLPLLLGILGDIGRPEIRTELERFSDHPDAEVARAARDALEVVELRAERRRSEKSCPIPTNTHGRP